VNKLAVGPAIRFAYQFTFGQLGTIIGLIWAPLVLAAILRFLPYGMGDTTLSPQDDPAAAGAAALRDLIFALAGVFLYAMVNVAVVRQALGLRTGGAVFHFSLGRTEFRVFVVTVFLALILTVLAAVCGLAVLAAANLAGAQAGAAAGGLAAILVAALGLCVMLVALVRLSFLYVPIAVMENSVNLERGWALTRGNFWRAGTVMFVATLPAFAVAASAFIALAGREFMTLYPLLGHIAPDALSMRVEAIMDRHIATLIGVNLIMAPFSLGLTLGAAAYGYRALAGAPAA